MNVAIDGRPLVGERTGVGIYTAAVASRLDPPPLICSHEPIGNREEIENCRFDVSPGWNGLTWQQFTLPTVARRKAADVLWSTLGTSPLRTTVPSVLSVHDLTSLTMPMRHTGRTVVSFSALVSASIDRACEVALLSETVADELVRWFATDRRKLHVVGAGVDPFFCPATAGESEPHLPPQLRGRDYVLYTGTIEPRKGLDGLLDAWESVPNAPLLVVAGGRGWRNIRLTRRLEQLERRGEVLMTGYVSRLVLRELYRHARLFVYPSLYEGFGLPPLEAMACGAPVVATAGGAIGEVVSDAACVIAPGDRQALARAIEQVLTDRRQRDELIERGFERARLFRWEKTAAALTELFRSAAAGG